MIEVDYGGRGHRTRLRDLEINCSVYGVPPGHVYKGGRGGGAAGTRGAPGGVLLPPGVGLPPLALFGKGRGKGERGKGGGVRPTLAGPLLLP